MFDEGKGILIEFKTETRLSNHYLETRLLFTLMEYAADICLKLGLTNDKHTQLSGGINKQIVLVLHNPKVFVDIYK